MIAYVTALRAVSATYARKIARSFFILFGAVLALLFIGNVYLINEVSGWWWLLLIPILSFLVVFIFLYAMTRFIVQKLNPPQSPDQHEAVEQFVVKLDTTLGTMNTPRFLVFIYLVRDAITGNRHGFIQQVTEHSKTLRSDFERLITLFQPL